MKRLPKVVEEPLPEMLRTFDPADMTLGRWCEARKKWHADHPYEWDASPSLRLREQLAERRKQVFTDEDLVSGLNWGTTSNPGPPGSAPTTSTYEIDGWK